ELFLAQHEIRQDFWFWDSSCACESASRERPGENRWAGCAEARTTCSSRRQALPANSQRVRCESFQSQQSGNTDRKSELTSIRAVELVVANQSIHLRRQRRAKQSQRQLPRAVYVLGMPVAFNPKG